MKRISLFAILVLALTLFGCNMPSSNDNVPAPSDLSITHTYQTVEAEMTRLAPTATQNILPPTATAPPTPFIPTSTSLPPATATPLPCNLAAFEADVTVPDGTVMSPGQVFTKTWRLRNVGTCTWTSGYQLVFHQGDAMGVPAGYAQALTAGTVPPGGTVDVSVNLTAPMTPGTYRGYWRLREPGGQYFGLRNGGSFWVQIQVSTAASSTVTLTAVAGESGTVRGDGHLTTSEIIVGDSSTNFGLQVFLSFNISAIPVTATITEVKIDFTNYTLYGDPFAGPGPTGGLGCLGVYQHDYGTLDAGDFYAGVPSGPNFEWCTAAALSEVATDNDFRLQLQAKLGVSNRLQARLQFPSVFTDSDGNADAVALTNPRLIVTYTTP
ncbi:MAG: NBR1-Ig-like domain-containing protein [Anaerolineales bacterium]